MGHWVDSGPSRNDATVTPSDATAQPVGRGLYVGTGGNVTVRLAESTADTVYKNVPSGTLLPIACQFIRATGTTAADMIITF